MNTLEDTSVNSTSDDTSVDTSVDVCQYVSRNMMQMHHLHVNTYAHDNVKQQLYHLLHTHGDTSLIYT